jgi:membrane associated rhomboid family serine protease
MIPIGDVHLTRRQSFPFINIALILANIAVFVYQVTRPEQASVCFTYAYSYTPAVILGQEQIPSAYALSGCAVSQYHLIPAWETVFTSMFLHGGLLHIGGNMLFLYVFGDNVEDRLGHLWYLIFYLFCGAVATATQTAALILSHMGGLDVPNLGASGAIAGVLGAYLIFFPSARVRTLIFLGIIFFITTIPAVILIIIWFLLQLFDGFASVNAADTGVAYFAHIGGFVVGLIIAIFVSIMNPRAKPRSYDYRRIGP